MRDERQSARDGRLPQQRLPDQHDKERGNLQPGQRNVDRNLLHANGTRPIHRDASANWQGSSLWSSYEHVNHLLTNIALDNRNAL